MIRNYKTDGQNWHDSISYKTCEQYLYDYVMSNGRNGSFTTSLINTITIADQNNQYNLAKGFPEMVDVVQRYQTELGYWESLRERLS